ncbi:MAG TPA: protein kinase [Blastocatellia bacterium]|nr:protein kinase [Blastocatellia bacterium]
MKDEIANAPKIINEALKTINEAHGRRLQYVQHIGSNRGVDVAKVAENAAIYSLKVIDHEEVKNHPEFDPDFRVESIRREGRILERLSFHDIGGYLNHGSDARLSWVVTRWIDGQSASELARAMRGDKNNDQNFLRLFSSLIRPVAALHQLGFLHADLQPNHFIRSTDGAVHLIDFGLTHEIGDPDAPYKGGLVHFNAPEVARQMIRKSSRTDYGIKSEIYSLGAILFLLYTGKVPVNYGSDDPKSIPFETKLRMIAEGRLRSFADCGAAPCLPIEAFLQKLLALDPLERFNSLNEALTRLEDMARDFDHLTSEAH